MLILVLKTLHVISIIAWMAGMLYLPRLFVYHADAAIGSDKSETFKVMERRLYKAIIVPAMTASWLFGLGMIWAYGLDWLLASHWLHAKLVLVVIMSGLHGHLSRLLKAFAADRNDHSARYFRILNEVPTVLMIAIVALVIIKPF